MGTQEVINPPSVPKKKMLPPLHIKLGIMKFVKALDETGSCFSYIATKFPSLSTEKLNFLGNHWSANYQELVLDLLENIRKFGFIPETYGSYSEEHGERFHTDLKIMEARYRGQRD